MGAAGFRHLPEQHHCLGDIDAVVGVHPADKFLDRESEGIFQGARGGYRRDVCLVLQTRPGHRGGPRCEIQPNGGVGANLDRADARKLSVPLDGVSVAEVEKCAFNLDR